MKSGNWYYDEQSQMFIEACEYLGVPYGFYYLDEALNDEEILEEVALVKDFLKKNKTSMNVLPLAIDIEYQSGKGRADGIWEERVSLLHQLIEEFSNENIKSILYVNGNRANQYFQDLEANLWVARYLEDGMIPESFYPKAMKYEEMDNILKQLLNDEGKLKANLNSNTEYKVAFSDKFLNKVIGWQFSESGANNDKIEEKIDLSLVKNDFFKQYMDE